MRSVLMGGMLMWVVLAGYVCARGCWRALWWCLALVAATVCMLWIDAVCCCC